MSSSVLPVHLADFTIDESSVQSLRSYVQEVARSFELKLDTLEGLSIANDFRGFTREFDTGFGPQDRPDVSDHAVGVTLQMLRKEQLGSHIILAGPSISAFGDQEQSVKRDEARYIITHELGHADEQHRLGERFAEQLIELHMKPNPFLVGRLAVWSEYYVCRKVASAYSAMSSAMEELLVRSTEEFNHDCLSARARVATSNDKAAIHGSLCSSAFRFFTVAARLLGHLDGLGNEFKMTCRIAPVYLEDAKLTSTLEDLHSRLELLWDSFPNWSHLDDLQSILVAIDTTLRKV
jgi:hypothetical protein